MIPDFLTFLFLFIFAGGFILVMTHLYLSFWICRRVRDKHPATWKKHGSPDFSFLRTFRWFKVNGNQRHEAILNLRKIVKYVISHPDAHWLRDKELDQKAALIKKVEIVSIWVFGIMGIFILGSIFIPQIIQFLKMR